MPSVAPWVLPVLGSAFALGFYDLCKKHALRDNPVMPVLFFATLTGSALFIVSGLIGGHAAEYCQCSGSVFILILLKSILVASSWTCVYYGMRELPISIAAPIRASSPLWTFIGGLVLFHEIPGWIQGGGMLLIFGGYYLFSVLGKLEGINFWKHRGTHMILLGTLMGAGSALYDKFLLNSLQIPRMLLQFWFSADLVVLLGIAYGVKMWKGNSREFHWRWSIPLTGILLIVADYLYFYAVSMPDIHISILSLVRRCNCIVSFAVGAWYFQDANVKKKAYALGLILLGVAILAFA